MTRKLKITLFIAIPIVALSSVLLYNYLSHAPAATPGSKDAKENTKSARGNKVIPVSVHIADYVKIDEGIRAVGTLLPNEEIDITSEIAGKVDKIAFAEGTAVKRGETLVKVNDDDLQSQLRRAEYQCNMLKEKLERNRILLGKDAISRESFDQIETDYNMVEADIQLLNVKIQKTDIRAPFDGIVGFRYISLGSYVQPGTQIARLVDNSKLRVEFSIPEKYYSVAKKGAYISFTIEGDQTVNRAQIYAISPKVEPKTRTVAIRAMYTNTGGRLLPGMFASVTAGQKSGSTIQIPTETIVPDAQTKSVWVVRDAHAVSVPVTTGVRSETMVEITRGITRGDSVIMSGLLQIKEGAPVHVIN